MRRSAPSGSYNGELELEVEEIFDGESFQIVGTIEGQEQSKIYDVTTKVDGKEAQPGATVTVKIPLPEGYDPETRVVAMTAEAPQSGSYVIVS